MLDDVHGGHREAGAVDEAGDVSVEGDVGEVVFGGLDFLRVFLVEVAEGDDLGVTVEGVAVEGDLRVEGEDFAGRGGDEGVDLDHGGVGFPEHRVEVLEELGGVLGLGAGELEGSDDLAELEIGDAVGGVDDDLGDLFGGVVGDLLDLDAALGGGDDDRAGGGAVEEDGEVILLLDVARDGEVDRLDLAAGGAGLDGDEGVVEHLAGDFLGVGLGLVELHAALVAVGEGALAAAAGVDLRLHHGGAFGELRQRGVELLLCFGGGTLGNGHPELLEQGLGLVFVNVHGKKGPSLRPGGGVGTPKNPNSVSV